MTLTLTGQEKAMRLAGAIMARMDPPVGEYRHSYMLAKGTGYDFLPQSKK